MSNHILVAYGTNVPQPTFNTIQTFDLVVKNFFDKNVNITSVGKMWHSLSWPDLSLPPYFNTVLSVKTDLDPISLLRVLHEIEAKFGRVRGEVGTDSANGPRTLDLDLISYFDYVVNNSAELCVPHPRAHERRFVMGPICDIDPQWRHPVLLKTAAELYDQANIAMDAYPIDGFFNGADFWSK